MRGEELLRQMELVKPEYVQAADQAKCDRKRRWIAWSCLAACFCVAILYVVSFSRPHPIPDPGQSDILRTEPATGKDPALQIEKDIQLNEPQEAGSIIFNEADMAMDASRQYIPGYFTEPFDAVRHNALLPNMLDPDMAFSGYVGFDAEGKSLEAVITIAAPFLTQDAVLRIAEDAPLRYYEVSEETVVCTYNGVDITAYAWAMDESQVTLNAYFEINGYQLAIGYDAMEDELTEAEKEFEILLDVLTSYEEGTPDLKAVVPKEIPEFFDLELTREEARLDEDFGAWMLDTVPEGFGVESFRRYKDQNSNYLSGLWTKGYNELEWHISFYDEEAQSRLTSAADTENYDLSLYPIPRAESVPDELREIVNDPIFLAEELILELVMSRAYKTGEAGDSNGWRMSFGVKYGDIIVEVRAKGVDPEWIYRQLSDFIDK